MSLEQFFFIYNNTDKQLTKIYEDFLHQNMAWENFGFYEEVEEYRNTPKNNLSLKAAEIFEKYIEVDSAHELGDITFSLRENIRDSIEDPSPTIFDELCDIVVDSLANATIEDFLRDPYYLSYVNKQLHSSCKKQSGTSFPCYKFICFF